MNSRYLQILLSSFLLLVLSGCQDDFIPYDKIEEGMTEISAEITFEPLTGINNITRTAGDAISDINSLSVLVYTPNKELVKVFNLNKIEREDGMQKPGSGDFFVEKINEDMPTTEKNDKGESVAIGEKAEETTAKATCTLPPLANGRYLMYAVANMDALTEDKVKDIDKFKETQLRWNYDDISQNNQMFGFFTSSENKDGGANGFEAPVITITKGKTSIHSWIKRAVSKVTVAFDPSGLKQDIWIYIHDVSIRDIPEYCYLGKDNTPGKDDSFLNAYDTPLSEIPNSSKIIYGVDGELSEDDKDWNENQDFKDAISEEVYTKWLTLSKGSGIKGSNHSETANALYFFENMQGDNGPSKVVESSEIVGDCITTPDEDGFKNGVRYGTYIEVTGYYVSQNIQNTTQGKIKYRFMLGKNITNNYNAQRNHHYKLTLGFDGWANQPKWNIEYYEEMPGIEVPDQFYVSYLYNQKHMMPIKIVGNCTNLTMEIVENNWAPYDPDSDDEVPPAQVGSGDEAFLWNRTAWSTMYKQTPITPELSATTNNTEFGFLALAVPINDENVALPKNIIDHEWSERPNGYPEDIEGNTEYNTSLVPARAQYWQNELNTYYNTNGGESRWNTGSQRIRSFTADQLQYDGSEGGCYFKGYNGWQVHKVDDESKMFLVPIFTRNKSMINSSGFSGNNPYDSYQRKAVIRVTATFSLDGGATRTIIKQIPILQVRRIVNPKGVWRQASTSNGTFDVTMLQIKDVSATTILGEPNPEYFSELPSEGSWKAFVDVHNGHSFLELEPLGQSYREDGINDTIYGDTDRPIEFRLRFRGVDSNVSACAVVKVLYHGNNCIHKILVRQGINEPLAVVDGGAEWSSFSLYRCTTNAATSGTPQNKIEAELTESPLALGTLFRRHNTLQGIRILNNDNSFEWNGTTITGRGPLVAPNGANYNNTPTNGYEFVLTDNNRRRWPNNANRNTTLQDTYIIADVNDGNSLSDYTSTWGTFTSTVNGVTRDYVIPSYDDFKALDEADYGVGVLYGDNTTEVKKTYEEAYGYQAPNNIFTGPATSNGARGMIIYNKFNGNQVFFPMGKNGMGRRTQFNVASQAYYGVLRYSDVSEPLTSANDYYRPVPYNLPHCPGAIYWLNTLKERGYADNYPCGGWDMNYFIVDFGPYPDNSPARLRDARPIKLVLAR
ncbi:MAG: hypothetical protein K2J63_06500 [Muribaculaceae bacterium]|nr:hypothetical protein [Muribaculaceae bacterium]